MIHTNYGYAIGLEKIDRLKLENLLSFSGKNFIDFFFNKANIDYIKKELKNNNWKKTYEKKYEFERELIYEKQNKKIFIYL
jgi:hypothetical protein